MHTNFWNTKPFCMKRVLCSKESSLDTCNYRFGDFVTDIEEYLTTHTMPLRLWLKGTNKKSVFKMAAIRKINKSLVSYGCHQILKPISCLSHLTITMSLRGY